MSARTKARKRALDVLFEADQRGQNVLTTLDARLALSGTEAPLPEYTADIVRGVASAWAEIDAAISAASEKRELKRMPAVDRAIARVATWEILKSEDVPAGVAISEAVSLAADLSTDDSATYLNGVLAAIARAAGEHVEFEQEHLAASGESGASEGDDATVE